MTTSLKDLQRAARESLKHFSLKSAHMAVPGKELEAYEAMEDFLDAQIANVYEAVKALVPEEDTATSNGNAPLEAKKVLLAAVRGWNACRELMIKRLSDGK